MYISLYESEATPPMSLTTLCHTPRLFPAAAGLIYLRHRGYRLHYVVRSKWSDNYQISYLTS